MPNYEYNVRELHWHLETRSVNANSWEEAKAKIALDPYDETSESVDTYCFAGEYEGGDTQTTVEWDILDDPVNYPVTVLHREHVFTAMNIDDIESAEKLINGVRNDYRRFVQGKPSKFVYVKPDKLKGLLDLRPRKENSNE